MRQYPDLPAKYATALRAAVDFVSSRFEPCAVEEAVHYAFWRARVWQPRIKDALHRLGEVEPSAAQHALAYYRAPSAEARLAAARSLFDALGMPTGFFEWDMEPETVL